MHSPGRHVWVASGTSNRLRQSGGRAVRQCPRPTARDATGAQPEEGQMAIHVSARPALRAGAAILIAALVLTLGIAPLMARGSDHLDAPNLGSVHVDANDNLSVTKLRGPVDINDLYVFDAPNGRTVLALTVNPAVNLLGRQRFNDNVDYRINIDRNGDARADVTYTTTFGEHGNGSQPYTVKRGNTTVARGWTDKGNATGSQGVMAFAGTRSDPFFFDLIGFLGSVKGQGTDALGKTPTDFFAGLDTYAIVLEVPNSQLGGNGTHIGVWGQTVSGGSLIDQVGRPAINTVFNSTGADKMAFNRTPPSQQRTAMGGKFRSNVITTLVGLSTALGSPYTTAQAQGIADILLPDVLTYQVGTDASFLNGRDLDDDVIDAELGLATNGAVTSDGVGAHGDLLSSFPYLGAPH